ncbi:MAG: hypothetical protein LBI49_13050 [Nocardiopsaceae bacterium]|nr:hypothetical protein [Nocardiopsaceae bacterium]
MNGSRRALAAAAVTAAVALVPAAGAAAATVPGPGTAGGATTSTATITVRPGQHHQTVDGFGFTEAFREPVITALPAAEQQRLGTLLFSPSAGAGMSIVRFGLGGATDPGDPISGPGDAAEQVWLGKLAEQHGVHQFYADAWSAPAGMKTNGSLDNGGSLCGSPGESCSAGDQRPAYASYLAGQAAQFAQNGIPLRAVGFVNEPEIGPSYASMLMTPAQAADFVPYLGRALAAQHLRTRVACCDAEGWTDAAAYTQAVLGSPAAARYVGLITGHGYTAPPVSPLPAGGRPVWESEWANFSPWDPAWDDGAPGSGMTWAQNISAAFTQGDVNAFFWWWGASSSTANSGLIQVLGPTINLSSRYWASAAFGRYIRPGAVRVGAQAAAPGVQVSAFADPDGRLVIEAINTAAAAQQVRIQLGGPRGGLGGASPRASAVGGRPPGPAQGAGGWRHAAAYLTDNGHNLAPVAPPAADGTAQLPARSLTTWVLPAG